MEIIPKLLTLAITIIIILTLGNGIIYFINDNSETLESQSKIAYLSTNSFTYFNFDSFFGNGRVEYYVNEYVETELIDVIFEIYAEPSTDLIYTKKIDFKKSNENILYSDIFYPHFNYFPNVGLYQDNSEILYLDFESELDKTDNENDIINSEFQRVKREFQSASYHNGVDTFVEILDSESLTLDDETLSIFMTVQIDPSHSTSKEILHKENEYEVFIDSNLNLGINLFDNGLSSDTYVSSNSLNTEENIQIAIILDSETWNLKMYYNDELTYNNTISPFNFSNENGNLYVGIKGSNYFNGYIDELRMFNRTFSKDEVNIINSKERLIYESYNVKFNLYYDGRFVFEKSFPIRKDEKIINFKNHFAQINGNIYKDSYKTTSDFVDINYQDRYKFINGTIPLSESIYLSNKGDTPVNITLIPNSTVFINKVMYEVPQSGELLFYYDSNFPNVELFFPLTQSKYIADLSTESVFYDYEVFEDVMIQCKKDSVLIPCDLDVIFLELNTIYTHDDIESNGRYDMLNGRYSIKASNDNFGVEELLVSINQDNQLVEVIY